MLRAQETAAPLSEDLNLPVATIPGLNEIAQGDYPGDQKTGRTRPMSEFADWGGESAQDFSKRVSTAYAKTISSIEKHGHRAAFFVHDGVLNVIVDVIEGVTHDGNIRNLFFNGSISATTFSEGSWTMEIINDVSHLPRSLLTPRKYLIPSRRLTLQSDSVPSKDYSVSRSGQRPR